MFRSDIILKVLKNNGAQLDQETKKMVKEDGLLILTHLIDMPDDELASELAEIIEKSTKD